MDRDLRQGSLLAGHRIERVLGRGGASVVYLAEHLRLGRMVALKILATHFADDEAFRSRFMHESRIAAALDHPNVVTVFDAGEAEGHLFISMRYIDGTDLAHLLARDGPLDPWRTIEILSQVSLALDAAHGEGLVHRDVKPGNILLRLRTGSGIDRAYLSDFGVTKRLTSGGGLTRTGQFVGTVDFVAPEQIRGNPVDGRTDVYSLGCVLYTCLVGTVPFERDSEVAAIYAHLDDEPPRISAVLPALAPLDLVIQRALQKEPSARPSTCGQLLAGARSAVEIATTGSPPREPPRESAPPSASDAVTDPVVDVPPPRVRSSARPLQLVVLAAVAILVVVLALTRSDPPSPVAEPAPGSPPIATTGDLSDIAWLRVPVEPATWGGAIPLSATNVGDGAVVVGNRLRGLGTDAAAWTSPDGIDWTSSSSPDLVGPGNEAMVSVVPFGTALVSVGWVERQNGRDARGWVSDDEGLGWTVADRDPLARPSDQVMRQVMEIDGSLLAIGGDAPQGDQDAASWTSVDGRAWVREPDTEVFHEPGTQQMRAMTVSADGVVVVGSAEEDGRQHAAAWLRTDDGWSSVISVPGMAPQEMLDVVAFGEGFVAVGEGGLHRAQVLVWTSDTGRVWRQVETEGLNVTTGHRHQAFDLIVAGSLLVLAGAERPPDGDFDAVVWTSTDAATWTATQPETEPGSDALAGEGLQAMYSLLPWGEHELLGAGPDGALGGVWHGYAVG